MTYFNVLASYPYGYCCQCGNAIKRKSAGGKNAYIYYCNKCTNMK